MTLRNKYWRKSFGKVVNPLPSCQSIFPLRNYNFAILSCSVFFFLLLFFFRGAGGGGQFCVIAKVAIIHRNI